MKPRLRRQMTNGVPRLTIRKRQVVLALKVEPELRVGAKPVAEAQRRVTPDGTLARKDLADTVRRHVDLARELGGRDAQLRQFILTGFLPDVRHA